MATSTEETRASAAADRAALVDASGAHATLKRAMLQVARYATNNVIAHLPMERVRLAWYRRACGVSIGRGSHIAPGLYLYLAARSRGQEAGVRIGDSVSVGDRCCLDGRGGLRLGDGTTIAPGCWLLTDSHDMNDPRFPEVLSRIEIGRNVWLGHRATVLPGVRIGDSAIVLPGAVVTKDVPPGVVVQGIPARPADDPGCANPAHGA